MLLAGLTSPTTSRIPGRPEADEARLRLFRWPAVEAGGRRDMAKLALSPALVVPFAAMAAWVSASSTSRSVSGCGTRSSPRTRRSGSSSPGLVLFGKLDDACKQELFFRRNALSVLRIGIVVEVYSEFFVLNLIAETLLVQLFSGW